MRTEVEACGLAGVLHPAAALAAALLFTAGPAHALQVIDARDGVSVEAILSIKEPTRIRIEGAPITDVFGNIYSSNCGNAVAAAPMANGMSPSPANPASPAINPAGEVVLECDRDKGEVYIRPVGTSAKPVNLFVSSAQATYTLLLRRSDTPADTIVIRDSSARQIRPESSPQGPLGTSANHVRAMKAMLVAMASDRVPPDVRVDEVNRPVPLWAEAKFSLMRRYEGRGFLGEKYLLQNISPTVMVLSEQEFDREDGNVTGVAIENHNLRPGETTNVFVIRRGSAR
ncbi:type-F conjugative transfer system secretin TraK [Sphaerotilus sp.]|uniref:type-F conjugative transfer system secretin TraK n=1 Tax=Sphaerotilus sp. TaxID=2093942 RepID=UPI002ACEBCEB|nr:type-F conjugative transfer system secretin TraK [Sphaerotilus sp.]MDZ7855313.1 type-F conjugative transfer system secretin TraK [Sphaerotilus sp.]